jgi:hypothetical protein
MSASVMTRNYLKKGVGPTLEKFIYIYIVCPQSPLGVLKNCGAQTN